MARRLGPFLPLVLLAALAWMQLDTNRRGERVRLGEGVAQDVLRELGTRSSALSDGSAPHPGFAALIDAELPLEELDGSDPDQQFAADTSYLYALSRRSWRDASGRGLEHGWELRAWPRRFGATGDAEYVLTQDGRLYESRNPRGRSGTTRGFPPPRVETTLEERGGGWWFRPPVAQR